MLQETEGNDRNQVWQSDHVCSVCILKLSPASLVAEVKTFLFRIMYKSSRAVMLLSNHKMFCVYILRKILSLFGSILSGFLECFCT